MRGLVVTDRVLANIHTKVEHLRSFLQKENLPFFHVQRLLLAHASPPLG